MNWTDFLVLGIIIGFGFFGFKKGLILSIFRFASFFISAILSVVLLPVANKIMTPILHDKFYEQIYKNVSEKAGNLDTSGAASAVVDKMAIPSFLKDSVIKAFSDPSKIVDMKSIVSTISESLTGIAISVVSILVLFVAIRFLLIFAKGILSSIASLPIIKQLDKVGGLVLGGVEGLLVVYLILALVVMFSTTSMFSGLYEGVNSSSIAKVFYENNLFINLIK